MSASNILLGLKMQVSSSISVVGNVARSKDMRNVLREPSASLISWLFS